MSAMLPLDIGRGRQDKIATATIVPGPIGDGPGITPRRFRPSPGTSPLPGVPHLNGDVGDNMTPERRAEVDAAIRRACHYAGYGAIKARIAVFGIEEHGLTSKPMTLDHFIRYTKTINGTESPFLDSSKSRAWQISFELVARAFEFEKPTTFRAAWVNDPNLLWLCNMLVCPKPSTGSWVLEGLRRREYLQIVAEHRVEFLKAYRSSETVVVCHGKLVHELAKKAFLLEEDELGRPGKYSESLTVFDNSKLILSPFFSNRWMPAPLLDALHHEVGTFLKR
jgi:hypothetical protein